MMAALILLFAEWAMIILAAAAMGATALVIIGGQGAIALAPGVSCAGFAIAAALCRGKRLALRARRRLVS